MVRTIDSEGQVVVKLVEQDVGLARPRNRRPAIILFHGRVSLDEPSAP
jgi:hypothetical protein